MEDSFIIFFTFKILEKEQFAHLNNFYEEKNTFYNVQKICFSFNFKEKIKEILLPGLSVP